MNKKRALAVGGLCLALVFTIGLSAYFFQPAGGTVAQAAETENTVNSKEAVVLSSFNTEGSEIYLAGGCFWGLEHLMQSIPA